MREKAQVEPLRRSDATHVAIACIGKVAAFVIWRRIQPLGTYMMMSDTPKNFDCVKFMREARRKICEETKHLTGEEYDEYWRKYRENDPLWQRLTAIEAERANASNQESRRVPDSD